MLESNWRKQPVCSNSDASLKNDPIQNLNLFVTAELSYTKYD